MEVDEFELGRWKMVEETNRRVEKGRAANTQGRRRRLTDPPPNPQNQPKHPKTQGTELGYVGLEENKYLFIPAYDSPEHTQNRRRALAAHSATLVDPAKPAVPVEHVEVRCLGLNFGGVGYMYMYVYIWSYLYV